MAKRKRLSPVVLSFRLLVVCADDIDCMSICYSGRMKDFTLLIKAAENTTDLFSSQPNSSRVQGSSLSWESLAFSLPVHMGFLKVLWYLLTSRKHVDCQLSIAPRYQWVGAWCPATDWHPSHGVCIYTWTPVKCYHGKTKGLGLISFLPRLSSHMLDCY